MKKKKTSEKMLHYLKEPDDNKADMVKIN